MRKKLAFVGILLLCFLLVGPTANAALGDIVLSFNAKADNTVGLVWMCGHLWNVDHGHEIPIRLHKLDPSNGDIIETITVAAVEHGMGLTWDGNYFWVVCHEDSRIYQIDMSGNVVSSFRSPNHNTWEAGDEGLAWDGTYLWYADSDLDKIFQLDPTDGSVVKSFASPASEPQGLTWDGSYLWHFDNAVDRVYKLDPSDGSVVLSFSAPGDGEGDLAWDGAYLWLSRNWWDMIFKIDVGVSPPPVTANVDVDPDTLNLKSNGEFVTVYIELPVCYDVTSIDLSTVELEGIPAVSDPQYGFVTDPSSYLMDHDGDGILERMVKFDRLTVRDALTGMIDFEQGMKFYELTVKITGEFDGTPFEGFDTITVIKN